jgi:hypothetical protein
MARVSPIERHTASDGNRRDDLLYEPQDLAATQGEHALRLAHLYLASARMSSTPLDTSAERDRERAECLFHWAKEAGHNTTAAGRCLLNTQLTLLKAELDAFDMARGSGANPICVSSAAAVSCTWGKDSYNPEAGSAIGNCVRPKTLRSASDAPQAARLLRRSR